MLELLGFVERVKAMSTAQTKMMKDPTHPDHSRRPRTPTTIPLTLSEGPLIPKEPIDTQGGDLGVSIELNINK